MGRPNRRGVLGGLLLAAGGLALAGCASRSAARWSQPMRTVPLTAMPDQGNQYWKDISGAGYSPDFRARFDYAAARVFLTYATAGRRCFTGLLSATGLKPNSCYQLKLIGKPTSLWGASGDDASNQRLGYAGRWWHAWPGDAWNATDAEYRRDKNKPGHTFEGYLFFDFFVTDATGAATVTFASDSSYHVIWKTSQRDRRRKDGPVRTYEVGATSVRLYAEYEPRRALPGRLILPAGHYNVQFNLTEESFHDQWPGWALVLRAEDVEFVIER